MQLIGLNTEILGRNSIYYKNIDSTQNELWRLYEKEVANGTLVVADYQTNAIGTHGRRWHTDEANNVAFSFLIKTNCNLELVEGLTIEIAKIMIKIIQDKYKVELQIKEPNDIVYHGKKIGGILTQSRVNNGKIKCLIIGIGINTIQQKFAQEIEEIATSIKKEFKIEIQAKELITEFCNQFEKEIKRRKIWK